LPQIKKAIQKTYGKRGEAVVQKNYAAVDQTLANLHEVKVPDKVTSKLTRRPPVPAEAPDFVRNVLAR
jgi:pyruvate-ferredoxin/flavodoxin oxidoreductase